MAKFIVDVTQTVEVEFDETSFDEAFMADFRESFYPFYTLTDHAEHIAQLQARGIVDLERIPEFVEGYGPSDRIGLRARVIGIEIEAR